MNAATPFRFLVASALLVVVLFTLYHASLEAYIPSPFHGPSKNARLTSHEWIKSAVEVEVSDPFDLHALSRVCLSRAINPKVVVECVPGTGGVGNIRSYILHCTRFAIEAGASMLLPSFHRRSLTDLSDLYGPLGDFEYFFDRQHFVETIQLACPHMHIYDKPGEDWLIPAVEIPQWSADISVSSLQQPSAWRKEFDEWFEGTFPDISKLVVLRSGDPGRTKSVKDDGMDFYYAFGRILKYRPDARRLAMSCIAGIAQRFELNLDPEQRALENAYVGAHLRTSSDAVKAGWAPDFEGQTDWYIGLASKHNLKVIYAAGGNDADLEKFATKAAEQGVHVVNKYDLLSGNDLREIKNMLWDQRGLVDFEVLLRASQFGGYSRSSFSHNIAYRRHFLSSVEDPFSDEENHFVDEYSTVFGRFDRTWEAEGIRTMWP